MTEHRWSGWPGAWCLDCGAEDASERCLATHSEHETPCKRAECQNGPCPEPESNRHNPYKQATEIDTTELARLLRECPYLVVTPPAYAYEQRQIEERYAQAADWLKDRLDPPAVCSTCGATERKPDSVCSNGFHGPAVERSEGENG